MDLRVRMALISAMLFGIGGPMAKLSVHNYGIDPSMFLVINGLCSTTVGLIALAIRANPGQTNYAKLSITPLILAISAGMIMNTSYLFSNFSLSLKGGSVALTYAITTIATLIAIGTGIIFMGESKNFVLHKFIIWTLIAIFAIYKAVTSIKAA